MTGDYATLRMSRARLTIAVGLLFLVPLMLAGIVIPSFLLISLAAGLLGIMTVPLVRTRRIDWFSAWNWLFYFTFLGVFVRSFYITFDIPDEYTIQSVLLLGEPKEFLLWPTVVVLLGLFCTTFGYLAGPVISRRIPFRIFQSDRWSGNRLWVLLLVLLSLSWVGSYLFMTNAVGQLSVENLSAFRGLSTDLSEYRAYGYFRWMINLSDLVCVLVAAKMVSSRRVRFRELVVFLLSLGTSLFYYFVVQSRSGIVVVVLNLLAIVYYMRGRRFPLKEAIVAGPIALVIVGLMTGLRPGSGYYVTGLSDLNPIRAIEALVVNNSGIDVSKTAHIMAAIGKQLDYQWGGTLLNIFVLWIPRELWPGKPTNVDTMVGMAVFGAKTYGTGAVPPGLIAEMYWNFWFPGIVIGSFVVGYLLRIVHTQFKAYSSNRNIVLLYVTSFMQLGVAFMGSGFASSLVSFLMTCIPLSIILHIITKRDSSAA